jgi:gamma-glutamyltranspeptidase/glutathione hydrolase
MVATQEPLASHVGLRILKQGGNAIDAAVAIGFALAVTYPQAGNLGGGGFMMIHLANTNQPIALDFRETAPANAQRDLFLDNNSNVDQQKARFSVLSSGVPGTVHGLLTALNQYGTMTRKEVLAPAIALAKHGFVISPHLSDSLKNSHSRLINDPTMAPIFFPKGLPPSAGERLIQSDMAKTLTRISKNGIPGFYQGKTANAIVTFMNNHNGLISHTDLTRYASVIRPPIHVRYHDHDIFSMPLPSSGGIVMSQILKLIEPYPIRKWGPNSAGTMHTISEAMSLAYADRAEWLGDSDFVAVPTKNLLNARYISARRQQINPNKHTPSQYVAHGMPIESNETTHYSVVDVWGNAVSVTTTLNFSYGSGIGVPGTGMLLNNQMDDFSAKPGVPNAYGLIGNEKNAIAPHKRMLSSMTPTIILKNQELYLVTGSPGGSRIITTVTQIISNVIDHNMTIAEATHAPRFHHQWWPDELRIESRGFSADTLEKLKAMGHTIHVKRAMGATQSIMKKNGQLLGASDPRSPSGLTLGY